MSTFPALEQFHDCAQGFRRNTKTNFVAWCCLFFSVLYCIWLEQNDMLSVALLCPLQMLWDKVVFMVLLWCSARFKIVDTLTYWTSLQSQTFSVYCFLLVSLFRRVPYLPRTLYFPSFSALLMLLFVQT